MLRRGRSASAPGATSAPSPARPSAGPGARLRAAGLSLARRRWRRAGGLGAAGAAGRPGSSWPRLRRWCAIAAVAAVPVLAGCEAGGSAPVLQWHQPNDGANLSVKTATTGIIGIHDLFILGDAPGSSLPAGSSASVFLVLANTGPRDRLVSMTAPGAATRVKLLNGRVAIPRSSIVKLSGPEPSVIMHGLTRTLVNGTYVRMVLHFQKAGYVALSVPVMARADYFASYSPAPSQSATPVRSALPKKHPRPTVSPSPTGSAPSPAVTPSGKTHTFNP